ncbi:hypothetical protein ACGF5C_25305 [Micromonospora sp. NPDC047620]|uniref:hypothetical protein n=1 Tax=Micromonospora sp. NPDC047620 TaxID=3364251 RepID=UPI00371E91D7
MPYGVLLRCEVVAWVDHNFPGWVRVRLVDADLKPWFFVDKVPIFTPGRLHAETSLPTAVRLRCRIVGQDSDGVFTVSTSPDGVAAVGGQALFRVTEAAIDRHTV